MTDTTNHLSDDEIVKRGVQVARAMLDRIERSRDEQPDRLARARAEAEAERDKALREEPWDELWSALPMFTSDGELSGLMGLPTIDAKELFGARLAFDMLDAGDDDDKIDEVKNRYFTALNGDTEHLFFITYAAVTTIARFVVPTLLDQLERHASDYDARVRLAGAVRNAWAARVGDIRSAGEGITE